MTLYAVTHYNFKVTFNIGTEDEYTYSFSEVDHGANYIKRTTGLNMLAEHIRGLLANVKIGDVLEFEDSGIKIEVQYKSYDKEEN